MKISLEKIDKEYVLQTYTRNYTNFVGGKNSTIYDDKGREYIDFTSGIGVVSVGHGNKKVAKKIYQQISKMTHMSNLYVTKPQALLAKKICKLSGGKYHTFFANSGAEANEGAIKIARKYGEVDGKPKRYKIITLNNSFHGRTITALKATGQEAMHNYFGPFPDGFVYAQSVSDIYNHIDEHTVAVMIELIQGEGGVEPQNIEQVQQLALDLKEKDILLLVDEVQTGVYRTGEFLASNLYGIQPDVITLAKGLGGGVPIGAVLAKNSDMLKAGEHGSTFGGNYLSTTAALEVLDILVKYKKSGKLEKNMYFFEKGIEDIFNQYQNLFSDRLGFGFMQGLRFKDSENLAKVIKLAHESGLLVLKSGRGTLRLLPPLTITKDEMRKGLSRLKVVLNKL